MQQQSLMAFVALVLAIGAAQGATTPLAKQICRKPDGFTGTMVLPPGTKNPAFCTPEFSGDGAITFLEYDFIPMDLRTLTPKKSADTIEACQAACHDADALGGGCQYYLFKPFEAEGQRCFLRLKGLAPADMAGKGAKILFEVAAGRYVAYKGDPSDWSSLGQDLSAYATFDAAKAACNAEAKCIGMKFSTAGGAKPWKTFGGMLWEGQKGKVRAEGLAINPWVKLSS